MNRVAVCSRATERSQTGVGGFGRLGRGCGMRKGVSSKWSVDGYVTSLRRTCRKSTPFSFESSTIRTRAHSGRSITS